MVYNIPTLSPRVLENALIEHKASLVIALPSQTADSFYIEQGFMPEPPASNIPRYILRVDSNQLTVLEVKDTNPSHDPLIPNKLPTVKAVADIIDPTFQDAAGDALLDRCEEHLFLAAADSTGVSVSMLNGGPFPGNNANVDLELVKTRLDHHAAIDVHLQSFCPLLGREYVLTATNDVFVFDYLVSPE